MLDVFNKFASVALCASMVLANSPEHAFAGEDHTREMIRIGDQVIPLSRVTRNNTAPIDRDLREALKTSVAGSRITEINVEVDYMVTEQHSHILHKQEIDMLVSMFACQGITLNLEVSDAIPETEILVNNMYGLFGNDEPVNFWI